MERGESYDEAAYAETLRRRSPTSSPPGRGGHRHRQRRRVRQGQLDHLPLRPDQRRRAARGPRRTSTRPAAAAATARRSRAPTRSTTRSSARALREAEVPVPAPSMWVCTGPIDYDRTRARRATSTTSRPRCEGQDVDGRSCPSSRRRARYWLRERALRDEEEFVFALADALHEEYKAIVDAGLMLQVDDAVPHARVRLDPRRGRLDRGLPQTGPQLRVDALNHALRGIRRRSASATTSAGAAGTARTPTTSPLKDIVDLVLQVERRRLRDRAGQPAPRARVARSGRT